MQICKPTVVWWGGNEEVVVLLFAFLIKNFRASALWYSAKPMCFFFVLVESAAVRV